MSSKEEVGQFQLLLEETNILGVGGQCTLLKTPTCLVTPRT